MISLILLKKCVLFCSRVTIELKKKDEKKEKKARENVFCCTKKKEQCISLSFKLPLPPLSEFVLTLSTWRLHLSCTHSAFFFKEEEYPKSNGASVHIPFMTTRPDLAYIRIELQITVKSQSRHISNFLLILILHTRQRDIY